MVQHRDNIDGSIRERTNTGDVAWHLHNAENIIETVSVHGWICRKWNGDRDGGRNM